VLPEIRARKDPDLLRRGCRIEAAVRAVNQEPERLAEQVKIDRRSLEQFGAGRVRIRTIKDGLHRVV